MPEPDDAMGMSDALGTFAVVGVPGAPDTDDLDRYLARAAHAFNEGGRLQATRTLVPHR